VIEPVLIATWFAVALRCFGFFTSIPVIARPMPPRLRLAFSVVLAFVVAPGASASTTLPEGWLGLIALGGGEFLLGLTMGWMALVLYAAIHLAGTIMGFQVGTGVSQLFDHQMRGSSGEMARLMTTLIGLAVVVAGGHHLLVRGLLTSFDHVPVGGQWLDAELGLVAARLMGGVLVAGCEMAMPVVAVTTLSSLAIGLATRATPQLNVYFAFGLLLNLVLGLFVASLVLQHPLGGIDQLVAWLVESSLLPVR